MKEGMALYTFLLDAKLRKRYQYMVLNRHITNNFIANRLRDEFLRAVNDAERAAGFRLTDMTPKHYGDGKTWDRQGRRIREDPESVKQNSDDTDTVSSEGEEVVG